MNFSNEYHNIVHTILGHYCMNPAKDYILKQPEPFKSILLHLQLVIEQTLPEVDLKYKWRVPFYYIEGRPLCYLNHTKGYVDLGFWNSAHLTVHLDRMTVDGRKMMRSLRYRNLEEIDDAVLAEVLQNAYAVRNKKFWK